MKFISKLLSMIILVLVSIIPGFFFSLGLNTGDWYWYIGTMVGALFLVYLLTVAFRLGALEQRKQQKEQEAMVELLKMMYGVSSDNQD